MLPLIIAAIATVVVVAYLIFVKFAGPKKFLPVDDFVPIPLIRKEALSHDSYNFVFGLPSPEMVLGLPTGQHVSLRFTDPVEDKLVQRSYTPVDTSKPGEFTLLVKVYRPLPPKFPRGGLLSQHLDSLNIGDTVLMKGPKGHMEWQGRGKFHVKPIGKPGQDRVCQQIGMMAGGTGITPMFQVLEAIFKDGNPSNIQVKMIYANQTEEDILMRPQLEAFQKAHPQNFHLWYTLDRPPAEGWKYSTGFINNEMVENHLLFPSNKEATQFLMCGPPPMIKFACVPALQAAGYTDKNWVTF